MKLPARYSKIKDEMKGNVSAAIAALALKGASQHSGVEVVDTERPLKPGIIRWDGDQVSFLAKGMTPRRMTGQGLSLDRQLEKTWATKVQGPEIKEFGFFAETPAEVAVREALKATAMAEKLALAAQKRTEEMPRVEILPTHREMGAKGKLLIAGVVTVVGLALAIKLGWIKLG